MVKPLVPPAVDILGPYLTTPQSASLRPGQTGDPAGSGFSWWKDCSDANAEDGTPIPAAALNNFKAQLLTLFLAGGISINDNDEMLVRSFRLQRPNFITAIGGTPNALTITLDPAITAYTEITGAPLRLLITAPNTATAPTLSVNSLAPKVIKRLDGSAIRQGDLYGLCEFIETTTEFRLLTLPPNQTGFTRFTRMTATGNYTTTTSSGLCFLRGPGGGGGFGNTGGAAGGGGSGARCIGRLYWAIGAVIPATLPAGGLGGATAGANGFTGATASFGALSAGGGLYGAGANGGVQGAGGLGGTASGGDINLNGYSGSQGYLGSPNLVGFGAPAPDGGGPATLTGVANASNGFSPGGGGSGSVNNAGPGGQGGGSELIIYE